MEHRALLIDGDDDAHEAVEETFISHGNNCDWARSQEEARKLLAAGGHSYIVLNARIPVRSKGGRTRVQNSENLLEQMAREGRSVPVIVVVDDNAKESLPPDEYLSLGMRFRDMGVAGAGSTSACSTDTT